MIKMKTINSLTEAEIDELPKLPDGWIWIRLGESIETLTDGSHFSPKSIDTGYPYITVKDIKNDQIDFDNCSKISEDDYNNLVKSGCKPYKGDILFSKDGTVGKVSLVSFEKDFVVLSSLAIIRPFASINNSNSKFLFWVCKSNHFLNQALKSKKGVAIRRIILRDLKELIIPFPPLPEQRAIVSKIEQLFSELDNGIANLKLAQEQLKVYRQAVLNKAFEGELTKKWREQQTDLPDAEDLLVQIRKEKGEDAKVCGKKIKSVKPLDVDEFVRLPKIPKEWCWVKLGDIGSAIDPQPSHRTPPVIENGIPYVGVGDIDKETGKFDFNNARKVSPTVLEEHLERYSIDEGDFIIGKIGTIGKPFLIPIRRFYALSANVVLVKSDERHCLKKYLFYLSKSQIIEKQFLQGSKATTQAAFGIQKVRILNIPFCSLPEQQAIVQEIETRLSVCDKIEQDIIENLEKAEALRQSILKKAFEGKLLNEKELAEVRGAEDWESAEALLERIKAERVKNGEK